MSFTLKSTFGLYWFVCNLSYNMMSVLKGKQVYHNNLCVCSIWLMNEVQKMFTDR